MKYYPSYPTPHRAFSTTSQPSLAQPGQRRHDKVSMPTRFLPLICLTMRCVRRDRPGDLGVSVIAGQHCRPLEASADQIAPCRHVRWWLASDGHWGIMAHPYCFERQHGGIVGWRWCTRLDLQRRAGEMIPSSVG